MLSSSMGSESLLAVSRDRLPPPRHHNRRHPQRRHLRIKRRHIGRQHRIEPLRHRRPLRHQLTGQNIKVNTSLVAPVMITGNAGQLQQVILNMVMNAQHAMKDGGTLTVSVELAVPPL